MHIVYNKSKFPVVISPFPAPGHLWTQNLRTSSHASGAGAGADCRCCKDVWWRNHQ